jgi:cation transport ATPase
LAQAHVGIVFSGTENGASIEASDIAVLGHEIDKLSELFLAAARTVKIARQSIYGGIIFSVVAMLVAALGYLHPVAGALTQEMIDIVVILNALRALHD